MINLYKYKIIGDLRYKCNTRTPPKTGHIHFPNLEITSHQSLSTWLNFIKFYLKVMSSILFLVKRVKVRYLGEREARGGEPLSLVVVHLP